VRCKKSFGRRVVLRKIFSHKYKAILICAVLFIGLAAYFYCENSVGAADRALGEVTVISGENIYEPFRQSLGGSDKRGGGILMWSGIPLLDMDFERHIAEVPVIRYEENFEFVLTGGAPARSRYRLYDNKREHTYYSSSETFNLPPNPGEYLLELTQSWHNDYETAAYQYFVMLIIEADDFR
jgi:hypothetical protein